MITPQMATYVLLILAILLAVVLPLLNAVTKLTDFISYRWLCVTIILLLMVGVVIDFKTLADGTRDIVLTGGMIIVGAYLLFRTIEKVLYNGWLKGVNLKTEIKKGETVIKTDLSCKNTPEPKKETNVQEQINEHSQDTENNDSNTVIESDSEKSSEESSKE